MGKNKANSIPKKLKNNSAKSTELYLKTQDSQRLYLRSVGPSDSKAVFIVIHGLNEHSGRYGNLIDWFSEDYRLYLMDQRGHGKSDGVRSYVDRFDTLLRDLESVVSHVRKKEPGKKIFMIAHSFGAQVLINYLATYKPPIAGFVTSSANIRVALKVPAIKKFLAFKLEKLLPTLRLPNEIDPKWICRDEEVVERYMTDPLVSPKITLKLACEILRNHEVIMDKASHIKAPAFMLHAGNDHICAVSGTEDFFKSLSSSDKSLRIYNGCYHEIFNEINKNEVLGDLQDWVEKRL